MSVGLSALSAIASGVGTAIQTGTSISNNLNAQKVTDANMAFQREQYENQLAENARTRYREDHAISRLSEDYERAGLNKFLLQGSNGAQTSALGSTSMPGGSFNSRMIPSNTFADGIGQAYSMKLQDKEDARKDAINSAEVERIKAETGAIEYSNILNQAKANEILDTLPYRTEQERIEKDTMAQELKMLDMEYQSRRDMPFGNLVDEAVNKSGTSDTVSSSNSSGVGSSVGLGSGNGSNKGSQRSDVVDTRKGGNLFGLFGSAYGDAEWTQGSSNTFTNQYESNVHNFAKQKPMTHQYFDEVLVPQLKDNATFQQWLGREVSKYDKLPNSKKAIPREEFVRRKYLDYAKKIGIPSAEYYTY
ncbi:MAG: hypothetical protein H9W81_15045 [Enterococcus sp.]|nr:hypothetical protein [Enterococcus sp.]